MGLGGAAGFMPPANPKLLGAGFAVAVTDTGHQGTILDWSFAKDNPTAMLDHAHRAGHVTAVATQALTRAFYGAQNMYRSEEHTSELQSLMRISYAVFCLKKKNNTIRISTHTH